MNIAQVSKLELQLSKGGIMRKRGGFMLLMTMFMAYIVSMPATVYGQSGPGIPLDEEGDIYMRQQGYSIIIRGVVFDRDAPSWEELLTSSGPECAHVNLVDEWDCQNPERAGVSSRAFGKTLQIYFDPKCDGEICFTPAGLQSSGSQPERGKICFSSLNGNGTGNVNLNAEIMDVCDTPIKSRNMPMASRVDMEESIRFYVTMTSNNENFQYPTEFIGKVYACGSETSILLTKQQGNTDHVNYRSSYYQVRELAPLCSGGNLTFRVNYISSVDASITMTEGDFTIEAINFVNDIPFNNSYGMPSVCYPFGEHLSFGTTVEVERYGWPPPDCQVFSGTVAGYRFGERTITTTGTVEIEEFDTSPANDDYYIDGNSFREKILKYNWKVAIGNGPERVAYPPQTKIKVFHGFKANPLIISPELPGDTVEMGGEVNLVANPYPYLDRQGRIGYQWFWEPTGQLEGAGHFEYGLPIIYKLNKFIPDYPGDVQLRYKITDYVSEFYAESQEPHRVVHIKPLLEIIAPGPFPDNRFSYVGLRPDVTLSVTCTGNATPSNLNSQIIWEMEEIPYSYLQTDPNDLVGETVTFEYLSMPINNKDFGSKIVIASLPDYDVSDTIDVLIFYRKMAINYPGGDETTKNWYYYWKQESGPVPDLTGISYDPDSPNDAYYDHWIDKLYITDGGAGAFLGLNIGGIEFNECYGIDRAATCAIHERKHQELLNKWRLGGEWHQQWGDHWIFEPDCWIPPIRGNCIQNPGDTDGDGLPDYYELLLNVQLGLNLKINNPDSYGVYNATGNNLYRHIGDQELIAMLEAEGALGIAELDWSRGFYSKHWDERY